MCGLVTWWLPLVSRLSITSNLCVFFNHINNKLKSLNQKFRLITILPSHCQSTSVPATVKSLGPIPTDYVISYTTSVTTVRRLGCQYFYHLCFAFINDRFSRRLLVVIWIQIHISWPLCDSFFRDLSQFNKDQQSTPKFMLCFKLVRDTMHVH